MFAKRLDGAQDVVTGKGVLQASPPPIWFLFSDKPQLDEQRGSRKASRASAGATVQIADAAPIGSGDGMAQFSKAQSGAVA